MAHRAIWILLLFFLSFCITGKNVERAFVVEVIDGDTIRLESGDLVRLLGINAPEKGQKFYIEAKERLKELVEGKEVLLEKEKKNTDRYGRLLRYVYVNGSLVNLIMVEEGFAYAYVSDTMKYEEELKKAEEKAKSMKLKIWEESEECERCIGIAYFKWDAEGDDCINSNDEFVVFKNGCSIACNLSHWTVSDDSGKIFVFPDFILESGKSVTLYSGCGLNTENELYWCYKATKCKAIWNNDKDTLYLYDSQGNLVLQYFYER
ncbi:MAG: thermonuclease family protein [Archaeoglobaceae archaeon]|nr:thermonuclease family protein [Archaeoglobaceae archaeon]MDW7990110.1 thermonuclease family protein [Archaeoglobaceae archaeon]